MNMKSVLILVALFFVAPMAQAYKDFKCKVIDSVTLEKDGTLSRVSNVAKGKRDKEFIVNRQTGQITGGGFVNTMSGQMPTVYNYLPQENGFKAVTIYKPHFTVDYLEISEYVSGDKKPFFYKGAWGEMVSGVCVYF
ncbi:hypothetical protein MJO52_12765 [Microbulbifer variabilis]|uniref:Uncharacterized protein n=1 Tax=Microbulbifer variabilis TaxID=266805 RepID=A0ABY4VAP4_9GAMM|nr:hypothetical protein [Microbulbifer variabilis]USD19950.1 hypothetical protein MJO52_12765 [Microbulbifer variabilis]